MSPEEILDLTAQLIAFRSLSGEELEVARFVDAFARKKGFDSTLIPLEGGRANVFIRCGTPQVLFSTHLDVVPGPAALFQPRLQAGTLHGRGACDAKGIAATMLGVFEILVQRGERDFGLFFVVGEETDGFGAKQAALYLKDAGVRYLVNGEPTELQLVVAHKGILAARITPSGRAAHSGYPHLGIDANKKIIAACHHLANANLGHSEEFGSATINIGLLNGGIGPNVVSPFAEAELNIRAVLSGAETERLLRAAVSDDVELTVLQAVDPISLMKLPGFEHTVAAYFTDIPHFNPLGVPAVLYGPGSIHVAHTDDEHITRDDIAGGLDGYLRIYDLLKEQVAAR